MGTHRRDPGGNGGVLRRPDGPVGKGGFEGMAQRIVGLDIGTSALRAVELVSDNGSRPVLEAYGQVGLRPGVIVDGEVRDQSQVAAALRRLWKEGGFRSTQVQLGVAGLRAITREMELPPLPPGELD